ncbi:hypothetical protein [Kitasatospora acidiphila]|uniref:hypothetical protein n=1 Tax=Kitasatospora acidiphila TaxID=2567942 RepID=UPI003C70BB90
MPQHMTTVPGREVAWRALTASPGKAELFLREPHLGIGMTAAEAALGPDFPARLQRLALLVIQPDCIAQRRVERCLDFLRAHDFEPVAAVPFVLEAEMTAEVWRYQVNTATEDSRNVCDLFCAWTESLLLVVRDRTARPAIPASLRLTALKGASSPLERTPHQLRTHLGATNRIVSAVHCSDEPIDLLREPPILLPTGVESLYAQIADVLDGRTELDLDPIVKDLYERTPTHDIDVGRAAGRILDRVAAAATSPLLAARAARLRSDLAAWRSRERQLRWPTFAADLRAFGIDPHSWDGLLVASEYLDYDRPGVVRELEGSGLQEWSAGQGELLV